MKKLSIPMYFIFLASLVVACLNQSLVAFVNDNCCQTVCDNSYDCGNPLNCGSINILVHGGIAPTTWRHRGDFTAVSCFAPSIPGFNQPLIPFFDLPNFKEFFRLPWIVGGQIGYAFSDCSELYVEFNYRQASKKTFVVSNIAAPNDVINATLTFTNNYRAFDAYAGARVYWGRYWCDQIALFLGAKFGIVHHKSVNFNYAFTSQSIPAQLALVSTASTPFFVRSTSPAGGANIGLDWCFGCGFSLVFMAEVVATCGPRANSAIPLTNNCTQLPSILPNAFLIGGTGTELFFPITVGLKYSF